MLLFVVVGSRSETLIITRENSSFEILCRIVHNLDCTEEIMHDIIQGWESGWSLPGSNLQEKHGPDPTLVKLPEFVSDVIKFNLNFFLSIFKCQYNQYTIGIDQEGGWSWCSWPESVSNLQEKNPDPCYNLMKLILIFRRKRVSQSKISINQNTSTSC